MALSFVGNLKVNFTEFVKLEKLPMSFKVVEGRDGRFSVQRVLDCDIYTLKKRKHRVFEGDSWVVKDEEFVLYAEGGRPLCDKDSVSERFSGEEFYSKTKR